MPWTIDAPTVEFSQPTQILDESQDRDPAQLTDPQRQVIGKLIANRGEDSVKVGQTLVVGRHRSCDVVVDGNFCSNHHCRIVVAPLTTDPLGFSVSCEDTSSNGTFLNRTKIGKNKTSLLSHGDTLEIRKGNYFTYLQTCQTPDQAATEEASLDAKYQITNRILGTGTFAQVKLAVCKTTGRRLAAKVIDLQRFGSLSTKQRGTDFVQEISIMQSINHPNIVQVTDVIRTPRYLYVFMPMLQGGDLFEYIMTRERLPEAEARFICYQVLMALKYLHERNISHRDVKPENVLLVQAVPYAQVMLTDFGMARIVGKKSFMQTMCGTFQYIAPEVITTDDPETAAEGSQPPAAPRRGYNKMVDCWSLGVLLYAMLSGTLPFSSDEENGNTVLFREIRAGKITFPSRYWGDVSDEARSMVRCLLVVDPAQRYTVHDALDHVWIRSEIDHLRSLYGQCLAGADPSAHPNDSVAPSDPTEVGREPYVIPSSPVNCLSPAPSLDILPHLTPTLTGSSTGSEFLSPGSPRVARLPHSAVPSPRRDLVTGRRHHPYGRPRSASRC
ncbi:hypothetical protein IWQ60_007242 [Tieghemiomyces parasiticus]|uniref:CAMK protein kinase n=1 Tax=Tieghemiomyces parasiticus TaxID=78921 RepID=A0A9W8A6V9_9FUNG|nr:hypothetical protein IWQ60_007242 [Tieghemiomyces parasiticus]